MRNIFVVFRKIIANLHFVRRRWYFCNCCHTWLQLLSTTFNLPIPPTGQNIHVQGQCLVPVVSSENLYGGPRAVNFLNLPMVLGFTRKLYIIVKVPYNCLLNLYFAIHYLNNLIID